MEVIPYCVAWIVQSVRETQGGGGGRYGVLQFVSDDGGNDRFLLQAVQGEIGIGLRVLFL